MSSGALSAKRRIDSGSGLPWTPPLAKSLPSTWGIAVAGARKPCGGRFLRRIKSKRRSIPIVTKPIKGSFLQCNTALSPSWPARPTLWNGSTARYGSGSPGWCVPRSRSRRNWPIISVPSSTSFVITTSPKVQPYLDRTIRTSGRSSASLQPLPAPPALLNRAAL
jgi:hypothetical protein